MFKIIGYNKYKVSAHSRYSYVLFLVKLPFNITDGINSIKKAVIVTAFCSFNNEAKLLCGNILIQTFIHNWNGISPLDFLNISLQQSITKIRLSLLSQRV